MPMSSGVANVQTWSAVDGASDVGSREQQRRGGDETIAGCAFVSVLREQDADAIKTWMIEAGFVPERIGIYQLLCHLNTDSL